MGGLSWQSVVGIVVIMTVIMFVLPMLGSRD